MYVRSQNKMYLSDVINFQIGGINHDQIWNSDDKECLGIYATEDRAFEVMDEIQDALEDGMTIIEDNEGQTFTRHMVFEMPLK